MNREDLRLETYADREWCVDVRKLARIGFYCTRSEDTVKCHFCRVEIGNWEPEDDVYSEHVRWSPRCPLLRRNKTTDNVPINAKMLENVLDDIVPSRSYLVDDDDDTKWIRNNAYAERSFVPTLLTSSPPPINAAYPQYADEANRLKTFENWTIDLLKPLELSEAGFFYSGNEDRVQCFSCGGGLRKFELNDVAWEQHALWYSKCDFLQIKKGQSYIDAVMKIHEEKQKEEKQETDQENDKK